MYIVLYVIHLQAESLEIGESTRLCVLTSRASEDVVSFVYVLKAFQILCHCECHSC